MFFVGFPRAFFLSDLLRPWHRSALENSEGRVTLAFEMVEVHICAAANNFLGNMLSPYAQAVCYERNGVLTSAIADLPARTKSCMDVYSRSVATIKAAKVGHGWF